MAIEVLSDLDWSDMNECCEKCIHLHAAFEDVNLETPCDCPCHTDKGEKRKEPCGYGCGRAWNEQGNFSNCPSAYHMVPDLERPTANERHEMGQSIKHAINRANDEAASTQPESSWEKKEPWVSIAGALHDLYMDLPDSSPHTVLERIKGYVEKEIEAAEKRGKNMKDYSFREGFIQGRLDVLAELEGKLPDEKFWPSEIITTLKTQGVIEGFNICRTTVLNIIKSIKGE